MRKILESIYRKFYAWLKEEEDVATLREVLFWVIVAYVLGIFLGMMKL